METLEHVSQLELEEILDKYNKSIESDYDEERLTLYVFNELLHRNGIEPETDEIVNRIRELCAGYTIRMLSKKGIIEPMIDGDGNDTYELTDLGIKVGEQLLGV